MSAWKPTDEQRRALGRHEASMDEAEWADPMWSHIAIEGLASADRLIESPAFQSIIRAAQAEALRSAARDMGESASDLNLNNLIEGAYATCTALDVRFLQDRADDLEAQP